jgi:DNA-binding NarL/FixJ family response regulator
MRAGLRALLLTQAQIEVVGESDGGGLAEEARRRGADVLVLDPVLLPRPAPVAATSPVDPRPPGRAGAPGMVLLVDEPDEELLASAVRAGVRGLVLREGPIEDVVQAVRAVSAGDAWVARPLTGLLLEALAHPGPPPGVRRALRTLTGREREVLLLMGEGLANADIADVLSVSLSTVKYHVSNILSKLGARDRAAAIALVHGGALRR